MAKVQKLGNLKANQTAFFLCDMQEKFKPAIKHFDDVLEVSKRLVRNHCPSTIALDLLYDIQYVHRQATQAQFILLGRPPHALSVVVQAPLPLSHNLQV